MQTPAWIVVIGAAGCAATARGQAFNIDCGGDLGTSPSATYGAGANQPGYWNAAFHDSLRNLSGNLTSVYFGGDTGSNSHVIPGATGDDKLLMETTFDMTPPSAAILTGLTAGQYNLYAYAWGGSAVGARTVQISVLNGPTIFHGSVTFSAAWPGGQVEGVTYAKIPVTVLAGRNSLAISLNSNHDFDVLNGLQLVPVPAPGVGAVMLSAGLLAARRRR